MKHSAHKETLIAQINDPTRCSYFQVCSEGYWYMPSLRICHLKREGLGKKDPTKAYFLFHFKQNVSKGGLE